MTFTKFDFPWPHTPAEGIGIQKDLVGSLDLESTPLPVRFVAGVDCSSYGNTGTMVGAVVVWDCEKQEIAEQASAAIEAEFPYIPGLLAFREIPAILSAFNKIKHMPDTVICDGQGIAHMRGFGIACHLGLYLDLPTVGCGKTRLVGTYEQPSEGKGAFSVLTYKQAEIGRVLRTRTGKNPLFVSPGHKCNLDSAVSIVLNCCSKFRLPDPIRSAHHLSNKVMKEIRSSA